MPRTRTITSCQEPDHCITLRHQHHSVIYASRPESDKVTELLLPHQHPVIHYYEPDALPDAQPTVTHTHMFNGPLSWTTLVSRYQKRKTNLDFTEARD